MHERVGNDSVILLFADDEVPLEVDSEGEEEEKVTVHTAKGKTKKGKAAIFSIDFDTGEVRHRHPICNTCVTLSAMLNN